MPVIKPDSLGPLACMTCLFKLKPISPAQYRARGQGLRIHYGFHESPFGDYLLAVTDKGICHLEFTDSSQTAKLIRTTGTMALFGPPLEMNPRQNLYTSVCLARCQKQPEQISVLLKGTNFQIQVWQALLRIPYGQLCSYETLAATGQEGLPPPGPVLPPLRAIPLHG